MDEQQQPAAQDTQPQRPYEAAEGVFVIPNQYRFVKIFYNQLPMRLGCPDHPNRMPFIAWRNSLS